MDKCVSRKIGTEITLGAKIRTEDSSKIRIGYKEGKEYAVRYTKLIAQKKPEYIQRHLSNELEALNNLKDSKIIKVYGFSYSANYIKVYNKRTVAVQVVYCLLDRDLQWNLMDIICFTKPFSERIARFYFKQLLSAVYYIHENGYAHRNLKLENLLLDKDYNLVITGFGFSKKLSSYSKEVDKYLSHESSMCPESLQSIICDPVMDDFFSLGYILFAMLFKSAPFRKAISKDMHYRLIYEHRLEEFWKQFSKIVISNNAKSLISSILAYEPIFRGSLCEIESTPWVEDEVPSLEEVQKEISELIKMVDQRARQQALNRKKVRVQYSSYKGVYLDGHNKQTRGGPGFDIPEGPIATSKRLPEESKSISSTTISSTRLYTAENPTTIERELSSYLVSKTSSFKMDNDKYKVALCVNVV